jgi:hypothetical protein
MINTLLYSYKEDKMKKAYLKRVAGLVLGAALVVGTVMPTMAAEAESQDTTDAVVWTLGQKNNVNGPKDGVQGENGWYFMYTDETDVAETGVYDTSKIKECVWANKGSMELSSESNLYGKYEYLWMPEEYLADGLTGDALLKPDAGNPNATFNRWVMTSDGTLNTFVETNAMTGIYAWEAPADGTYNFDVNYAAGGDHCEISGITYYYENDYYIKDGTDDKKTPEQREGGVALSVSTKNSKKAYAQCIAKTKDHDFLYSGLFTGTVELQKGDMIYFAVDPREVGSYDMANLQITITVGDCKWGEPVYEWDGYGVCTATTECSAHKDHVRVETAEGNITKTNKEADCVNDGEAEFEATFDDGTVKTATQTIKALGHDYTNAYNDHYDGKSKFVWADDYSTCTWMTPCARCGEMGAVDDDSVTIYCTAVEGEESATCTTGGKCEYQASFYWGWVWTDKVEATTEKALGHDYSKGGYEWSEDNSKCTKHYYCTRCGEEDESKANTVATVKYSPSCTEDGSYCAIFDWGYDWQFKDSGEKATGHKKLADSEKYEWSDDYTSCTKYYVCETCEEEVEEETVDSQITKASCIAEGKATAAFKGDTEPQTTILAATGHEKLADSDKYKWSDDYTTCTKYYVCDTCKEEIEEETVNSQITEASCTEDGKAVATFKGDAQPQTVTLSSATGHSWGEWTTVSAATTESAEVQKRVCKNCNEEETRTVGSPLTETQEDVKVTKVTISGISKQLAAGAKVQLTATIKPAKATNQKVTWKSSNAKYATVTAAGKVTLKKAGAGKTVTITATAKDGSGKKDTYKITIMKNAVKSVKLSAAKTVKAGSKLTVKATVKTTGSKVNKKLKWTTSNKDYATVSSKGVVKAKKAGAGKTVTITATATDGSNKKAFVKIKIKK